MRSGCCTLLCSALLLLCAAAGVAAEWQNPTPDDPSHGPTDFVFALAYSDGEDAVYIGGTFDRVPGCSTGADMDCRFLVKYQYSDKRYHSPDNAGDAPNSFVEALLYTPAGILYVGGNFVTPHHRIMKKSAPLAPYSDVGNSDRSGPHAGPVFGDGEVHALAVLGKWLYVGGSFSKAGGSLGDRIVRFDTTSSAQWEELPGTPTPDNRIESLVAWRGSLLIGGFFTTGFCPTTGCTGVCPTCRAIVKFDPENGVYSPIKSGGDEYSGVRAFGFAVDRDDEPYVCGWFNRIGDKDIAGIAYFNDVDWTEVNPSQPSTTHAEACHYDHDRLVLATLEPPYVRTHLEGDEWDEMDGGVDDKALDMLYIAHKGHIWAGGKFKNSISGVALSHVGYFTVPAPITRTTPVTLPPTTTGTNSTMAPTTATIHPNSTTTATPSTTCIIPNCVCFCSASSCEVTGVCTLRSDESYSVSRDVVFSSSATIRYATPFDPFAGQPSLIVNGTVTLDGELIVPKVADDVDAFIIHLVRATENLVHDLTWKFSQYAEGCEQSQVSVSHSTESGVGDELLLSVSLKCGGLGGGAIAGIVIGVLVAVILAIVGILACVIRQRRKRRAQESATKMQFNSENTFRDVDLDGNDLF